jgi:hypothetical protein
MLIKCTENRGAALPPELLEPRANRTETTRFAVTIGQLYTVYALTLYKHHVWYYICDDDFTYFPVWNPAALFDIIDHRVSSYWELDVGGERCEGDNGFILAYPEWAADPFYYERLADNRAEEVSIFEKYRKLIDSEHRRID